MREAAKLTRAVDPRVWPAFSLPWEQTNISCLLCTGPGIYHTCPARLDCPGGWKGASVSLGLTCFAVDSYVHERPCQKKVAFNYTCSLVSCGKQTGPTDASLAPGTPGSRGSCGSRCPRAPAKGRRPAGSDSFLTFTLRF